MFAPLAVTIALALADKVALTDLASKRADHPIDKGIVCYIFELRDCPNANRYTDEIKRIHTTYGAKKVQFFLVYEDPDAPSKETVAHHKEFGFKFPGLYDPKQMPAGRWAGIPFPYVEGLVFQQAVVAKSAAANSSTTDFAPTARRPNSSRPGAVSVSAESALSTDVIAGSVATRRS